MNNAHELAVAREMAWLRRETARLEHNTEEIRLERDESIARIQKMNIGGAEKQNELLDAEVKNRDAKRTRSNLKHRIAELEAQALQMKSNPISSTSTPETPLHGTQNSPTPSSSVDEQQDTGEILRQVSGDDRHSRVEGVVPRLPAAWRRLCVVNYSDVATKRRSL